MYKVYSANFSTVATGETAEKQITPNKNFRIDSISLAGNSTNTYIDTIGINIKIEDTSLFNPEFVPASALKNNAGNNFELKTPIVIEEKKYFTVKIQNTIGTTLSAYNVIFHGEEI